MTKPYSMRFAAVVFTIDEIVELYELVGIRMAEIIDLHKDSDHEPNPKLEHEYELLKSIREKVTDIRLYAEGINPQGKH